MVDSTSRGGSAMVRLASGSKAMDDGPNRWVSAFPRSAIGELRSLRVRRVDPARS